MTNGLSCNVSAVSSFPSSPIDYIERNTFRSKPCSNFDSGEISLVVERVNWPIGSFLPKKADIRIHTLLYSIYRTFEINVKILKNVIHCLGLLSRVLYSVHTVHCKNNRIGTEFYTWHEGIQRHCTCRRIKCFAFYSSALEGEYEMGGALSPGIPSTYFCCQKNVRLTGFNSVCRVRRGVPPSFSPFAITVFLLSV